MLASKDFIDPELLNIDAVIVELERLWIFPALVILSAIIALNFLPAKASPELVKFLASITISLTAEICPALTRSLSTVKFNSSAREAIEDKELLFRLLLDMLKAPLLRILFELVIAELLAMLKLIREEIDPKLLRSPLRFRLSASSEKIEESMEFVRDTKLNIEFLPLFILPEFVSEFVVKFNALTAIKFPELVAESVIKKVRLFCAEFSELFVSWFVSMFKLFFAEIKPELFKRPVKFIE